MSFQKRECPTDLNKVKDVKEAPPPGNVSEVCSFLGMVNYCRRFRLCELPELT